MSKNKKDKINLEKEIIIGINNKKQEQRTNNNRPKNIGQAAKRKKEEKTKRRRKIYKRIKKFLELLFLLGILAGALLFFLMSDIFNIKNINVENNEKISSNTYISLSKIQLEQNIFAINKNNIVDSIKTNAYVENVKIKRKLPDTIIISTMERETAYILKYETAYAYVDCNGYILEISDEYINVPMILGYKTDVEKIIPCNRLCEEDLYRLDDIIKILDSLKTYEIYDTLTAIDISNKENYKLIFEKEGKVAYIGDTADLSTKMLYIKYIIQEQKNVAGEIYTNSNKGAANVYFSPK